MNQEPIVRAAMICRAIFLLLGLVIGAWGSSQPQRNPYTDPLILQIVPDDAFNAPAWDI